MPVFKCKCVGNNNGVQTDELGFTLVDLDRATYMTEPFIMASQAKQIFYVTNPYDKRCSIILQGKHIPHSDENHDLNFDIPKTPSSAIHDPTSY